MSKYNISCKQNVISGTFPKAWKEAKVPTFKSGSKEDVNNYRPISILPTLSKIIERWVHNKTMSFLNSYSLLYMYKKQSGFRVGHSTESALISMIDSWLKAINDGKIVGCIMGDFRKAFYHNILFKKLTL